MYCRIRVRRPDRHEHWKRTKRALIAWQRCSASLLRRWRWRPRWRCRRSAEAEQKRKNKRSSNWLSLLLCALHMQANTCACICDGKLVRLLSCEPRLFVLLLFLLKTFRLCSKRAAKMLSAMPCESKLLNSWAERTRLIDFLCCSYCCCGNMLRLAGTMSVLHKRFPFAHFVILHNRFFTVFAIVVFALPGDLS